MSYLTENEPNLELVDIFNKLSKDELNMLVGECRQGNYGQIATAIKEAYARKPTIGFDDE